MGVSSINGGAEVQVGYNVTADGVTSFEIDLVAHSADAGVADVTLQSNDVTGASDLTLGHHQIDVPITFDTNPWSPSGEAYLRAEIGADPTNSANLYGGAVLTPDDQLLVFGTENSDSIALLQGTSTVVVNLNSQDLSFPAGSVSSVCVYGYGGNDLIWAAAGVGVPMIVYGTGTDSILGDGNGGDYLNGGPGSWISDRDLTNETWNTYTNSGNTTTVNLFADSNNDGTIDTTGTTDSAVAMGPGCNVYAGGSLQQISLSVTDTAGQYNGDPLQLNFDGDGTTIEVFDAATGGNRIYSGQTIATDSDGFSTTLYVEALTGGSSGDDTFTQRSGPQTSLRPGPNRGHRARPRPTATRVSLPWAPAARRSAL